MEVNIKNLEELLKDKFYNNKSLMARTMGIEVSHITKVFKGKGRGAGAKFLGAIIRYCEENNLNYRDYIFLTQNVNKFTK